MKLPWRFPRRKKDDFEATALDLRVRAHRLAQTFNPHDLGNDEVVFAVAQFVRVLGTANRTAGRFTWALIALTVVTVVLVVYQIYDGHDEAQTEHSISLSAEFFNNANNLAVMEAIDDGGPILVQNKGPIRPTQLDHYLGEFDTIDSVYQHGRLRDEDLCDNFKYYVDTIYKTPEIVAYIKDQRRNDPQFFVGLDDVRNEMRASSNVNCR